MLYKSEEKKSLIFAKFRKCRFFGMINIGSYTELLFNAFCKNFQLGKCLFHREFKFLLVVFHFWFGFCQSKSGFYQRRIFLSVGHVKRSECTANLTGLSFFLQPISAQCWRRRAGRKILRILGKQTQKDLLNLWRNRKHCELKPRKL